MTPPDELTTDLTETSAAALSAAAERLRIAQLSKLFAEISATIEGLRAVACEGTISDWHKVTQKLSELQTVHVKILTAEEAFHDKYSPSGDTDVIDYDVIRHDIGRALDRIRATSNANDVSGGPEGQ